MPSDKKYSLLELDLNKKSSKVFLSFINYLDCMKQRARDLTHMLFEQENQMLEQLILWCHINSGSTHLSGLALMHETLRHAFTPFADIIESHALPSIKTIDLSGSSINQNFGELLFIRKRPHLTRRILLSGHMDTVYNERHPLQMVTQLDKNTLNGPGVADMKGGIIVMLHALLAFEQFPAAATLGIDVVINADEELGSPASRIFLESIVKNYQAAFVYEPSTTPEGIFAKNRKGSGKLSVIATGKSSHAGRAFDEGRNAICYLAEAILAIHALNGIREGVTLNIGQIAGGEALNIVPDHAIAKLDVRITTPEDEQWVRQQLEKIFLQLKRPDYFLKLDGDFERPVKRVNWSTTELFLRIQQLGKTLGLNLDWQDSGGCCDGNNLAQHGLAVIDTLGVRGGAIHSINEFMLIDSLVERTALSTLLLLDLAEGGLEAL